MYMFYFYLFAAHQLLGFPHPLIPRLTPGHNVSAPVNTGV